MSLALCAELHAALGSKDFDKPCIRLAGRQSLHFEPERDFDSFGHHLGMHEGIIPCVARGHPAFSVRPLMKNLLQLCVNAKRLPPEAERNVDCVHAQIAHDTDLATGPDLTLPISGLGRIEIAAVVKAGMDFKQLAKAAGARQLISTLRTREKWKFRAAGRNIEDLPCISNTSRL
jgi:hypothetical protein